MYILKYQLKYSGFKKRNEKRTLTFVNTHYRQLCSCKQVWIYEHIYIYTIHHSGSYNFPHPQLHYWFIIY